MAGGVVNMVGTRGPQGGVSTPVIVYPAQAFTTFIREDSTENIGVGGELLLNRHKSQAG